MHDHGTRLYRVRAVAEMFDVSVSTIYRAIEAGQLDALRLGKGKGAVRIPAAALAAFADACALAANRPRNAGADAAEVG
jgi:excisionase family DNA binding protein